MATINDFKREISELVKAQKVAKRINHQSEVYRNRGLLHAMYVAYYILKHKLVGDAQEAYYKQVLDSWKKLKFNGWYGCSGGDGSIIWNYDEIRELYAAGHSMKDTAKIVGCHPDTVSKVVKDIKRSHNNSKSRCGSCKPPVKIEQYNEDMLVQVFDSVADAAHWCVDNGYAKTYNGGVRSHISNAAKHKTKTAYGYRWEYAQ